MVSIQTCMWACAAAVVCAVAVRADEGVVKRRPWYIDELQRRVPQYAYYAHRRDYWPCSQTGQECSENSKCCSKLETCITSLKYSKMAEPVVVDKCVNLRAQQTDYRKLGEKCSDSRQCATRCCREFRAHRQGRVLSCGPQDEGGIIYHNCV